MELKNNHNAVKTSN